MKFIHLSDLHIGKRINEFSMLEDQRYILEEILNITQAEQPDGVLIAGDVYDKSVPGVDGVTLFDDFLTRLYQNSIKVFIISGNHDSPERLGFGGKLFADNQVYLSGAFDGEMKKIELKDRYGSVDVWLLPFVKPAVVNAWFPGTETYHDAVLRIIEKAGPDESKRNVLVAHQFVTSQGMEPERCQSETITVGGVDNVDASVFDCFDYVALGHIHGPQKIFRDTLRYGGSPLKYSFSEANHKKSLTVVELKEKGNVDIRQIPLVPLRDMRQIKGPIEALLSEKNYSRANRLDYIHATLTDEEELYDPIGRLRSVYPNLMRLDFENSRTKHQAEDETEACEIEKKSPLELFEEFFISQNGTKMNDRQKQMMARLFDETEGGRR